MCQSQDHVVCGALFNSQKRNSDRLLLRDFLSSGLLVARRFTALLLARQRGRLANASRRVCTTESSIAGTARCETPVAASVLAGYADIFTSGQSLTLVC